MITDDDYSRAGLLPSGYVLRARSREARLEYNEWTDECIAYLDDDEPIPQDDLVEWVDWQIAMFLRVAAEERMLWSNPVWWSVKCEYNRRELLAAYKGTHDYMSRRSSPTREGLPWRDA